MKNDSQGKLIARRGLILILSSPSGAGKSSICRAVVERDDNITISISVTTRAKRPGEVDGKDYIFISQEEFERLREEGAFIESAKVYGNYYGTLKSNIKDLNKSGKDIIFDIDWQGTQQLRENIDIDIVSIYILPPSLEELKKRLGSRAQDPDVIIEKRMKKAKDEISHWPEYDYVIVNDDLEDSIEKVRSILQAERLKRKRQLGLSDFVNRMRGKI